MSHNKLLRISYLSLLLFPLLTFLAMFLFPGGTFNNPDTEGYLFFQNFFSDLGRLYALNGGGFQLATTSLFVISLCLVCIGQATTFKLLYRKFKSVDSRLNKVPLVFGIASAFGFLLIAAIPVDISLPAHMWAVYFTFGSFAIASFSSAVVILRHHHYEDRYAWAFLAYGILLMSYIALMLFGPGIDTVEGLQIQAGGQKIVVYLSIVSVIYQLRGASPEQSS